MALSGRELALPWENSVVLVASCTHAACCTHLCVCLSPLTVRVSASCCAVTVGQAPLSTHTHCLNVCDTCEAGGTFSISQMPREVHAHQAQEGSQV